MKVKDLTFTVNNRGDDYILYAIRIEGIGSITVLDRLTGWGDGDIRDIETGYRDLANRQWIASGNFDIREYQELSIHDAVEFIKKSANTCRGD